jgi:hypothetical protein
MHSSPRQAAGDSAKTLLKVILKNGSLLIQEGEEPIKLIPFLVLNEKMVGLDMKIPPGGENIGAMSNRESHMV